MNIGVIQDNQFEVVKYLYQFKDDNKFYPLDKDLFEHSSHEEKFRVIYALRDNALIATDREIESRTSTSANNSTKQDEVKARILPKGIMAVEALFK